MGMRTVNIWGYVVRIGNQYVGWNSFKSKVYLTTKSRSEIFASVSAAAKFMEEKYLTSNPWEFRCQIAGPDRS